MSSVNRQLVQLEKPSRRDVLRGIALALTAAGAGRLSPAAAQQVHQHVSEEKKQTGKYEPKFFQEHEYKTLARLAELIIPADEGGGSAVDAGAAEFIDLLCSQNADLGHIYTGGLLWMDAEMRKRRSVRFVEAAEEEQTAVLDSLIEAEKAVGEQQPEAVLGSRGPYSHFQYYGLQQPPELAAGVTFFRWLRRMTADAYYTSPIGIKDLGFLGNGALSEYTVPQEIIDLALSRSPFGSSA